MANTLRFKRGLVSTIPTALAGEPLFTTDTFDLYIGNGTTNTRFQKYIASGTTGQLLRGDGSLLTMPIVLTSPSNGQVLKYDGTNWVNSADAGVTGSGTTGQVTYWGNSSTITGSNNLFWDASNNRLGIGTNAPAATLEVSRSVAGGGLSTILANPTFAIRNPANWGYPVGIVFRTPMQDGGAVTNIGSVWCEWQSDNNSYLGFATNTSGTVSEKMRLNASGRLLLGSTTDNGQRLQVIGDTLLRGSGNTSATTALLVENSDASDLFTILNNGYTRYGNAGVSAPRVYSTSVAGAGDVDLAGEFLAINLRSTTTATTTFGLLTINGLTGTATTGTQNVVAINKGFAPTSGTATYTALLYNATINQTGGANGITRGLYVNPTLTAAADWRSIEWSNNSGWGLYGAGTSNNYINGSLAIGTTTFNDNLNPYKAVVFYNTSGSGGGGLMVTSNQAANAANAMVSAVQWGLNNGSVSKPSGLFFNYSNTTHGNRAIDTVGNLISKTLVAAANLSITNNNGYIQHVDLNSTSNDYVNYQGYLYVQRNSGTVNVNSYTSFRSMYQTAVANETITEVIDFRAAQPTLSTGALVTNRYGLLIDFNNTQVTNAWGVYQSQSTVNNYMNGALLIGTTTVGTFKLDVNGTMRVSGASTITGNLTVDTNTLFVDATNDRVAIGRATPAPTSKLFIQDASNGAVVTLLSLKNNFNSVGTGVALDFLPESSDVALTRIISTRQNLLLGYTSLDFQTWDGTANSSALFIAGTAARNVGVGTTSPAYKLDVNGTFGATGAATFSSSVTGASFIPTSATIPTNGMYLSAANTLGFATNGTLDMTIDAAGNLGLGVTPSAWVSTSRALQISRTSIYNLNGTYIGNNYFINTTPLPVYINNGFAQAYSQESDGAHKWFIAPSGTAGNTITFTQAMTLHQTGNLAIGTGAGADAGFRLDVNGTMRVSGASTFSSTLSAVGTLNLQRSGSGADTTIQFRNEVAGNRAKIVFGGTNEELGFYAGGGTTEHLRIANSGIATFSNKIITASGLDAIEVGTPSGNNYRANIFLKGTDAGGGTSNGYFGINVFSTSGILDISNTNGISIRTGGAERLGIASTGAATFSSTAQAAGFITSGGTGYAVINSAANTVTALRPTGGGTNIMSTNSNGLHIAVGTQAAGDLILATNNTERIRLSSDGFFSQGNGTNPTSSIADSYIQYSADVVAGNAAPHFRTENGAVIKLYQETSSVAGANFVAGFGTSLSEFDQYDGYTIAQVVKALRNQGILS